MWKRKDLTGEAMIIAYRKERFQSVSLETFWLSPTRTCRDPAIRYRVCARVLRRMWYLRIWRPEKCSASSTPIWITSAPGRESLAWSRFYAHLRAEKAFADVPVILSGDFNAEPDSEEMKPLRGNCRSCECDGRNRHYLPQLSSR